MSRTSNIIGTLMSDNSKHQVSNVFREDGWQALSLSEEAQKAGLLVAHACSFAAAGVVIAENVDQVLLSWADCQAAIAKFREDETVGHKKDLYLIFVVPAIDQSKLAALQVILDDTHVCRKICLEQAGRSLEETLPDSGLLTSHKYPETSDSSVPDAVKQLMSKGLSKQLLGDLASRSPRTVLDNLLAGKYAAADNK